MCASQTLGLVPSTAPVQGLVEVSPRWDRDGHQSTNRTMSHSYNLLSEVTEERYDVNAPSGPRKVTSLLFCLALASISTP